MDSYEFLAEQVERIEAPKREHERLKQAVVEAAKAWRDARRSDPTEKVATAERLILATDALNTFESGLKGRE